MIPNQPPAKRSAKDDLSTIWDLLKSMTFFLGIYLFFLGWVYLYFYFEKFGISSSSVSIEISSYYNFGFFALINANILWAFIAFVLLLFYIYYYRQKISYAYVFIVALIILFFGSSFYITKHNAQTRALGLIRQSPDYKTDPIYFDFTADFLKSVNTDSLQLKLINPAGKVLGRNSGDGVLLLQRNNQSQLQLIYENKDSYFVFFSPENDSTNSKAKEIYNIEKKNINYSDKIKSYHNEQ